MLGRTIQNKDKHLYPAVNHVKKVISAHEGQKLNNNAMLEHTKTKQAKQRAKIAILGRTVQRKDKYLVNHVKKVISAHEGQKFNSNAMLEHTKTNRAKQRARIASPGSMVQKHAKQLKYKHVLRAPLEK